RLPLRPRHLGHVVGVIGARAVDVARVEDRSQELHVLDRYAFHPTPAGLEPLRGLGEETPGLAPVLEHTEHARVSGDARDLRRVVHRVPDQHTRAWRGTGLIAQELVGHRFTPSLKRTLGADGLAEGPTIP